MTPEQHADAILRAAGSSLANYTMPGTRAAILAAVQAVRDDERDSVVAMLRGQMSKADQFMNLAAAAASLITLRQAVAIIERGEDTAYCAAKGD